MGIKDLFGKTSNKVVGKAQNDKLADEVESYDLIDANVDKNNKLVPRIDYSEAKNFAHYGSAEKYYEDSINYILKSYPYDGSEAEKISWRNKASGLDEYILDYSFPKTTGHVRLNTSVSTHSTYAETGAGTWQRYTTPQYIKIKGGPNKDPSVTEDDEYELSKQFPPKGGRANIWDDELFRESNLGINPSYGNTVEFWAKFTSDAWVSAGKSACLFDLWNGEAHGAANYVRMMIEVLPQLAGNYDFAVTYKYGSGSEGVERIGLKLTTATEVALGATWRTDWHHYAFAISNTDSGITVDLYINGVYESTNTAGNKITSTVPQENYIAYINALRTKPVSGSPAGLADTDGGTPGLYVDEFRYWKNTRNAKQIGRYWFTPVYGGTNTDNTKYHTDTGDMIDLGVYYKFNEGIYDATTANTTDAQCLDYSGRISNGTIGNYSIACRVATSAMDESTKVIALGVTEEKDPVMYSTHSDVVTLKAGLMLSGSMWDMQNNASFYHTMPGWILEEDEEGQTLKTLVQALSSYFDTLHSQIDMLGEIRDSKYFDLEDSQAKPVFFAKQLLRSVGFDVVDIFGEATILEEIVSRGEQDIYDNRIQDIKNVIYQNIYNNISYIYKSKGTEKSFRNLIRCFGVDDEIVKLNLYADGVDYTLEGRRAYSSVKKNYIDFNHVDRNDGCAYSKDTYGSSSDERSYIAGMTAAQSKLLSTTLTAEVIFPLQLLPEHPAHSYKDFTTISLFGCKEANLEKATATIAIADSGGIANADTFTLVDSVGTSTVYTVNGGVLPASGGGSGGAATVGFSGVGGGAAGKIAAAAAIATAINATTDANYAAVSDGVSAVTITQGTSGTDGNRTNADSIGSTTVSNFTGGYEIYDQTSTNQIGRMQVQAIMGLGDHGTPDRSVTSAKFKLIYTDADGDHELVTDEVKDVWENSKWNFAIRIYPTDAPLGDYVSGSDATKYNIDFCGVQVTLDTVQNVFTKTATYSGATPIAKARAMIASPKICYIGHYRDNFAVNAGSLKTDVKVADLMYWFDKLEDAEIQIHGTDVTNTGRLYPNDDAYQYFQELSDGTTADIRVPKKDTLALHWNFANVRTSDASGTFIVDDVSLGGASYIAENRYGWFTGLIGHRHTGFAEFDSASCANDTNVINREYAYTAIHRLPEILSGDDMVEIRVQDDDTFGKNSKPINHFWAIEKSMYQVISQEMLSLFASVVEFNDLIGQPVHRYRMEYKSLQKFRSLFYERVDNIPSFEKFVAFYKWLDSSLGLMLQQLIPASGNFSDSMRNLVENHLLERSKYWTKFPTLEMKQDPPEATLRGIRELTYDWEHGSAPIMVPAVATIAISDAGGIAHGDTFTLIDSAGVNTVYTINGGILPANGGGSGGAATVGFSGVGGGAAGKIAAAAAMVAAINATTDTNYTAVSDGVDAVTITQGTTGAAGNRTNVDSVGHTTVSSFTGGTGSDSPDHCLWWNERTNRTWDGFDTPTAIDTDREKIRKAIVRDVLGQNKMVKVSTGGHVEEGDPTLYDIATAKQYEGSTYATRRLSRPYKLNLEQAVTVSGGPNFANATPASPNDMIRASTTRGHNVQLTRNQDDPDSCQDEYSIQDGPIKEKRRSHVVTLTNTITSVQTELKGSLVSHSLYGTYPNDASTSEKNVTHDSYGQDHEIPMQGIFASEWVGGNQHRHIDLNKGSDADGTRPELYKVTGGNTFKHPHDVNTAYPAARRTRDGTAKRPFNVANINTAVNEDNYTTYTGTPKLGNYTKDYEVVQTSGRSQNNRWHVKNPAYTPDSIASTYVSGLYDFSLPDRTKNSAGNSFGRTEHVFVERFSAPGEPATMSRGALDIQAEEYSAYNSINFRNLRVRNHLNFWHKEHAAQFGYREDYIHGTESDAVGGVSNDFGGNTANVGSWHKNNRNPLTRMHLQVGSIQQPFCLDPSYGTEAGCTGGSSTWTTPAATIESRRRYDNFYVSHQIPQSDWQYGWITSSAVHFADINEYDDEQRGAYTPTTFPAAGNYAHPRLSGYITDYSNATIGTSGSLNLLSSGSIGIAYTDAGTPATVVIDVDFVYGNYAVVDEVDWVNNLVGTTCPVCTLNRPITEFGGNATNQKPAAGYSGLNALLLNRNGPYQGAGWKMLQNAFSPIVRQQRKRNVITVQSIPDSNKVYEDVAEATVGSMKITVTSLPTANFTITAAPLIPATDPASSKDTITIVVGQFDADHLNSIANAIGGGINTLDKKWNQRHGGGETKIKAKSSAGSSVVRIRTIEKGIVANTRTIKVTLANADVTLDGDGNMTKDSALYFEKFYGSSKTALPIKTETGGLTIVANDDGTKTITVNFQDAEDEKIRTWNYNDRRSDNHEKYIEPPATWNKPMMHILSEKTDNMGLTAVHSYSNNLKTFANPKLSYRTGFETKTTAQNYDVLYDKYSPTTAIQPTLDFVGLYYKEYIFPKNRNVGLLKTRARASWDDVTDWAKQYTPTGDLRIFWKDNYFERIKGPRSGTVNALGYTAPQPPAYLLDPDGSGSLDDWYQVRSIFAMDNFVFDQPHPTDTTKTIEWKAKGDLQYVGWETYMSWIVNRSCEYVSSTDWVNYNDIDIADLTGNQQVWQTPIGNLGDAQMPALNQGLVSQQGLAIIQSLNGTSVENPTSHNAHAAAGNDGGHVSAYQESQRPGVSNAASSYQKALLEFNNDGRSPARIGGMEMVWTDPSPTKVGGASPVNASLTGTQIISPATAQTATRADMLPRCSPPEVVAQLYYNPHGANYKEGAWLYETNNLRGKNPWYDKYVDFSLETRCMAQNYGIVAEFRISEHMEKYLMVDSGDFRTKNFNFLSLHGASYNTVAPHYATTETAWSGKVTFPYDTVHSIDGTMDNVVTEYPHADEIYSGWANLSVESGEAQAAFAYLQNRIKTMNIAFSVDEGRGTFNSPAGYTEYSFQNPIFAGGSMTISNSTVAGISDFGSIGVNSAVLSSTPWDGRVSWGQGNEDDGTGRHRWFATKEDLIETETESGYKGTDPTDDGTYGYDDPALEANTPATLPPVYREANSFTAWKSVLPFAHDANDSNPSVTSLKFNMNGVMDEYLHGQITMWDKFTTSAANDTDIYGVAPFAVMTASSTINDSLRVPNDRAEQGSTTQGRTELYNSASTIHGTPMTISVWVKPERTVCTPDHVIYDGKPVGLYVFGQYEFEDGEVSSTNTTQSGHWRRDLLSAKGRYGLYSNFPAPASLSAEYPSGMGLTFFMNNNGRDVGPAEIGTKAYKQSESENMEAENIYHFFRRDQRPADDSTDKWVPATLLEGEWGNVVLQILPAHGSNFPSIKLTLTDRLTRPDGNVADNVLYEQVLYGIHRSALTNGTYEKRAYSTVPVGQTAAWGATYGFAPADGFADELDGYCYDYKLGKAIFSDKADDRLLLDLNIRGEAKRGGEDHYWYFHGEMAEFSLWAGILSKADIDWVRQEPRNLLEGYLNGEVLGGYTNAANAEGYWGNGSPSAVLPDELVNSTGSTGSGWTFQNFNLSTEASRSTCKLTTWHRLGIKPTINITEACEDWDDEFFNSYVHTDTIQFYDAIVEDHDAVSDTLRRRLRFKVNALKKLIPYRGFYPQDRTLQLANLFAQKMTDSITGADESVLRKEQAMQAAMQPFFAPGILYNSIKAGVAVDWPAFTNATGLEPVYPNSQCSLPYYNEDVKGTTDDAEMDPNGPDVRLSSIVPNWYNPRLNPNSSTEGLLLEYEQFESYDDVDVEEIERQQHDELTRLYENQPKFFTCTDDDDWDDCHEAANGYVIRQQPNMRIPFEGLVSLDSVLPKASDEYESLDDTIDAGDFKHVDIEISGWDCEGIEISLKQPVCNVADKHNPDTYPDGEQWTDNYTMQTVSVTIGDNDREMNGDDWDVTVNFQRPPKGYKLPSFLQDGTSVDSEEGAWSYGEPYIKLDHLNEEIAVALCRHINSRPDIHYVAIPGALVSYHYSGYYEVGATGGGVSDDYVALNFPACYPEVFDINRDDLAPHSTAASDPTTYDGAYAMNLHNNPQYWKTSGSTAPPPIGKQHNGTWRVRLVYVGPPKIKLDMKSVELAHTEMAHADNRFNVGQNAVRELGMRPYSGIQYTSTGSTPATGYSWEGESAGTGYDTVYDSTDQFHNGGHEAGTAAYINSQMWCNSPSDINTDDNMDPDGPTHRIHSDDAGGAHWQATMNWKTMHLINPFKGGVSGGYDYPMDIAEANLPSTWLRKGSHEPYSFFDGGGTKAVEWMDAVLGDTCALSLTRHLGTLTLCEWVDGWGWKGEAKYSIDTELGIRYVNQSGVTEKGNLNDRIRGDYIRGKLVGRSVRAFKNAGREMEEDRTVGVEESLDVTWKGGVAEMEESAKPQQGAFPLYGGYSADIISGVRVTPKPHQIYLMTPEYYIGHGNGADGGGSSTNWGGHWKNYCYPYFEYLGSNNDNRFEMAMHNFLAEVPNFFLRDGKLVSFSSKPENEFKVMTAGKTYYMNISMHQSENFTTVASPYSDVNAIGRPSKIAFGSTGTSNLTMEGRYYGPAFQWKGLADYTADGDSMERQMLRDPAQAPYVPPYLYGKQTARISFTPGTTKQYSVEEIFAGAKVENVSAEAWQRFVKCAQEDNGNLYYNSREILASPAWKSRTTISASMNLFGKSSIKQIEYSAQLSSLRDDLDESLQKFVPQTATDSPNDVWTVGTKWECPILNFYTAPALSALAMPALVDADGEFQPPYTTSRLPTSAMASIGLSENGYVIKDSATDGENSGAGIWSSYGTIPAGGTGVFVTVEESTISSATKDSQSDHGSLVDVCGFTTGKEKVGEVSESKEISEAVVMIPFVDKASETTAETTLIDGRHFFKINKDLFNLQKMNIEAGYPAVRGQQWLGVQYDVQETSISQMIRGMKKYNIPPKYDFVRYPMEASDNPFVMYIFEFNHKFNKHDLADIWQGLPPRIALSAEHDSTTLVHDLSSIDFFEENTLPRHVRWMTFKIKKRAKENYYEYTAEGADDQRFEFNFESGKTPPKYSYNWPYDYFTMLEMIQVEAGVDIFENSLLQTPLTFSSPNEISTSETQRQVSAVKAESVQDMGVAPTQHSFGTDEDR